MAVKHKPKGHSETSFLDDFTAEADKNRDSFGKTELYSTGFWQLDKWMGGGFGKAGSFEVVLVFGEPGVGKSTVAMQFMKDSVEKGVPQAWIILEDDLADANMRFRMMFHNVETGTKVLRKSGPRVLSPDMIEHGYSLDDVYNWIEARIAEGIELFLFDHIQFAFDDSEDAGEQNEIVRQRNFMKRLVGLFKRSHCTMVLVSHTNKDRNNKAMGRILGSTAIAQTATKIIEVTRNQDGTSGLVLSLLKNRHAKFQLGLNAYATREQFRFEWMGTDPSTQKEYPS